jgi:hypothetical protein
MDSFVRASPKILPFIFLLGTICKRNVKESVATLTMKMHKKITLFTSFLLLMIVQQVRAVDLVDCPGTTRDCPPSQFGQPYTGCAVGCYDESFFSYGVTYCYYEGGNECFRGLCYGTVPDGIECDLTQTGVPSPPTPTLAPTKAPPPTTCPPTFDGEDYVADGAACYEDSFFRYGVEVCFYENDVVCHNGLCYGNPYTQAGPLCNPVPTQAPSIPTTPAPTCGGFRAPCSSDDDCCSGKCGRRRGKCRR